MRRPAFLLSRGNAGFGCRAQNPLARGLCGLRGLPGNRGSFLAQKLVQFVLQGIDFLSELDDLFKLFCCDIT